MQTLSTFMFDKSHFFIKKLLSNSDLNLGNNFLSEESIDYIWSKDSNLVKQYMKMIDETYDDELNLEDSYKKIGLNDLNSHFFIVKIGSKVISGVRLTINNPMLKYSLPTEKENFNFADLFTEIDFTTHRYSEITKYTMHVDYRNNPQHYIEFFSALKKKLTENKVKYFIICGSRARNRIYKKFASEYFNYIDMKKLDISLWPEYASISFAEDSWAMLLDNESIN